LCLPRIRRGVEGLMDPSAKSLQLEHLYRHIPTQQGSDENTDFVRDEHGLTVCDSSFDNIVTRAMREASISSLLLELWAVVGSCDLP
jgi:hypothetical protein